MCEKPKKRKNVELDYLKDVNPIKYDYQFVIIGAKKSIYQVKFMI